MSDLEFGNENYDNNIENNANIILMKKFIPRERFSKVKSNLIYLKDLSLMPNRCTICYEFLKDRDFCRMLPCIHTFHYYCIDRWFEQGSTSCPICMKRFEEDNDFSINPELFHTDVNFLDFECFLSEHLDQNNL